MKPKTTIILALLLLVCLAMALFTSDLFTPAKKTDHQAKKQAIFESTPGKIVELTVAGPEGKIAFQQADGNWRITQPIAAKADTYKVNEIADALKDLKGSVAEGVGNDTTGLDKPLWTVTAVDDKKATFGLEVGRTRPMKEDQTYVRVPGGRQTFVADVDFARKLNRPVKEYRNNTVLELKSDQVERLSVTGKESYELIKRDGTWGVAKPFSAPGDPNSIRKVLDQACRVTAAEFVADAPKDLAAYGLDKNPRLIVELQMQPEKAPTPPATGPAASKPAPPPAKPGKAYGLTIGAPVGDKFYAKLNGEPAVFKVNAALMTDLQPKLTDLRVRQILTLKVDDVTEVDIEMPEGKATLVKKDINWLMTSPVEGKADYARVMTLLNCTASLKAESFSENAPLDVYGLDKPAAKLTFRQAGKGEAITLLVGGKSPSGEMTFVKTASGLAVAVVKTADLKGVLGEPATYWDRTLLKLPAEAKVTRLQLRRVDDTFTADRDPAGNWALSAPLAAPADKDTLNKLIDRIENLQADRIVNLAKSVPDIYAKATDIMQVVVTAEQPPPAASEPATTKPAATAPAAKPAAKPETTAPAVKPAVRPQGSPGTRSAVPGVKPAAKPATGPAGTPGPTASPASAPTAAPAATTKPAATKPAGTQPAGTQPAASQPAVKPIVQTYQITVVKVGLHSYAWLAGAKIVTVGEFAPTLYDDLAGELRSRKIWAVEADKTQNIRLAAGADSLEIHKDGKAWAYPADAYVKIDETKVETYLKDLASVTIDKFVAQKTPADLKKYGLDKPWLTLELTDKAGAKSSLTVSNEGQDKTKDRYALASTVQGVFLVPAASIEKLGKKLVDFKK
jgi:hypothetical protein